MARISPYTTRGRQGLEITTESINAIEDWIRWAEIISDPTRFNFWMDTLVHYMALTNQGIAQRMSAGPYDPREQNRSAAWKIPVRRISERYYLGWKVRRVGVGAWMLYNDSREAYFIEFGISQVGYSWAIKGQRQERLGARRTPAGRVRRPIRKLSAIQTLKAMARTNVYHRVWASIHADPRKRTSPQFRQYIVIPSGGFGANAQSPSMGSFQGPLLGRKLP